MEAIKIAFSPQAWPTSVWVLLLGALFSYIGSLLWRPALPKGAPELIKSDNWPILGAWRFYTSRYDFYLDHAKQSKTGNFAFHYGQKRILGLAGHEARDAYFGSKDLNFAEGFAELFVGQPPNPLRSELVDGVDPAQRFLRQISKMLKRENFVRVLGTLTSDTKKSLSRLADNPPASADPKWKVFNSFEDIYRIIYQLTMRLMGATEIAEDPALLSSTLSIFEKFDKMSSPMHIIFPWLPTPNHLARLYYGGKLYMEFEKLVKQRQTTGQRYDDAIQYLIDQGEDTTGITTFMIAALFAGQINSGINACWILCELAMNAKWKQNVLDEVAGVVKKYRTSEEQSATDVLSSIDLDVWENEFPVIDLALRETIRLGIPGTSFRKNLSGKDIPLGTSGEVIPKDFLAVYLIDDAHLNPEIYKDPMKWDPDRFLPDRAEDKSKPMAYIGWGLGRHPCLGMKFAKLEIFMIVAFFAAMFDWEISDRDGLPSQKPPPPVDRNQTQAQKPAKPVYLRYRTRDLETVSH